MESSVGKAGSGVGPLSCTSALAGLDARTDLRRGEV